MEFSSKIFFGNHFGNQWSSDEKENLDLDPNILLKNEKQEGHKKVTFFVETLSAQDKARGLNRVITEKNYYLSPEFVKWVNLEAFNPTQPSQIFDNDFDLAFSLLIRLIVPSSEIAERALSLHYSLEECWNLFRVARMLNLSGEKTLIVEKFIYDNILVSEITDYYLKFIRQESISDLILLKAIENLNDYYYLSQFSPCKESPKITSIIVHLNKFFSVPPLYTEGVEKLIKEKNICLLKQTCNYLEKNCRLFTKS